MRMLGINYNYYRSIGSGFQDLSSREVISLEGAILKE